MSVSVAEKTGSHPADIKRFRIHTGNDILISKYYLLACLSQSICKSINRWKYIISIISI